MRGLTGRRVLVTGAAGGIGRATAGRFAAEGARVALSDRDAAAIEVARAALPAVDAGGHAAVTADVARDDDVERLFASAIDGLGGLDIVVLNAGFVREDPSASADMTAFDAMMAVNLRGTVLCARAAIRHYLAARRPGVVLLNSSVHREIPKPGFLGYAVSKGAFDNLVRTLALEFAAQSIRVNAVAPGATVTPINASWTDDPVRRASVEAHIPLGRAASPGDIAAAFAFLASDDAAYVTGQTLTVDGGLVLHPEFRENWAT